MTDADSPADALRRQGSVHIAPQPDVVHPDPDCRALDQTDWTREIEEPEQLPLRCSVCGSCFGQDAAMPPESYPAHDLRDDSPSDLGLSPLRESESGVRDEVGSR
jgi:hypothetical protein